MMEKIKKYITFQNIILVIGVAIGIYCVYTGYKESNGFPDEKYVAAAAFALLISTSLMQNIDLNINKRSLDKQIEELKFTRKELKEQTKEFNETNKYNKESLEITQFYEMLTLREEISRNADCHKFNKKVIRGLFSNISNGNWKDSEIQKYKEVFEREYKDINIINEVNIKPESSIIRLYTFNKILENLVNESPDGKSLLFEGFKDISKQFLKSIKHVPSKRYKRSDIFEMILTDDEKVMMSLIENDIDFKTLIKYIYG